MTTHHPDHPTPTTTLALIIAALILGTPQLTSTPTTPTPEPLCPAPEQTTT